MASSYSIPLSATTPPANIRPLFPKRIASEESPEYDSRPTQRAPFMMVPHEVADAYQAKVGPIAWSVYTALVRFADTDGACFPSVQRLCDQTGIKKRETIFHAITKLVEMGLIKRTHRFNDIGSQTSNIYELPHFKPDRLRVPPQSPETDPPDRLTVRGGYRQTDHELDTGELDPQPTVEAAPKKKSMPRNGPAQTMVAEFCELAGIEQPTAYRKTVGQADLLVKAGCSVSEMKEIFRWLANQRWTDGAVDLGTILGSRDKFLAQRRKGGTSATDRQDQLIPGTNRFKPGVIKGVIQ